MDNIIKKLENPANKYRPIPFWSWNDKLDPSFLSWQIEEMKSKGLGGYFMHARGGIETEYLSEDWFSCISTGIEKAQELKMDAWLYDESGWPSGFAAGKVPTADKAFQAKGLKLVYQGEAHNLPKAQLLGSYTTDRSEKIEIYYTSSPYYIDVLNPDATAYFIQCTHEEYYARYKEKFGTVIKGFFTDEPRLSEGAIPWSHLLQEAFKSKYGYDITENLPKLFLPINGYEKVRYDFWCLVSDMFVKSFMKQIYDWCTNHNCQLTGHVMMEETVYSQMTGTAGSMPFYEYMHIPGVDWLRRTMENPIVSKQVGSVAEQLGKELVLTETYALAGWDVSFEELRWMAAWQYVNGVNLMCQHLEAYSLRGMRKRDYPPSLFFQQSWWEEYGQFNDYLARLSALLGQGKKEVEILLLHPMQSGWITYDGTNNQSIKKIDADFALAVEDLASQHCDFHLGDEEIIKTHGSINANQFVVGGYSYSAIVMPTMATISKTTLTLLQKFITAGGKVFSYGEYPKLCEGEPSAELSKLQKDVITIQTKRDIKKAVTQALKNPVSISNNGEEIEDIRYNLISAETENILYMVNLSKTANYHATVLVKGNFTPVILDLLTLKEAPLRYKENNNSIIFSLDFSPMQSFAVILKKAFKAEIAAPKEVPTYISLDDSWTIKAMSHNSLTLDKCAYRINDGELNEEMPVILLMEKLLKMQKPCKLEMTFTFNINADISSIKELYAAIEQIEKYEVKINGNILGYKDIGWWKDSAFKKIDIRSLITAGENTLTLTGEFYQSQKVYDVLFGENVYETELNQLTYDTEIESIYLIGDFGVISNSPYNTRPKNALTTKGGFTVVNQPKTLKSGNFTPQGLTFFAGAITIEQEKHIKINKGSRAILKLQNPRASMIKLWINHKLVKTIMWAPYDIDITDFVEDGNNAVTLELFASNRNLLGPHHHIDGEVYNAGPESFTGKWSWVERPTEGIDANPADLEKNYWSDNYTFVTFGID